MSWVSLTTAEKRLGVGQSTLVKLVSRHRDEAPKPNEAGKYDFDELVGFHSQHCYIKNPTPLKDRILEEELRLKRVKADEAERRVIPAPKVLDLLAILDSAMRNFITETINDCSQSEREKEQLRTEAKARFKFWRNAIAAVKEGREFN